MNEIHLPKYPNTNKFSMDSVRIRMPFNEVEILDDNLGATVVVYNEETSEQLDSFKKNSIEVICKGYSIFYRIQEYTMIKGRREKFLVILLSAKILELKDDYLGGITRYKLESIYSKLMSHEVAYFNVDTFLKAVCTDIDYKKDFYIDRLKYKALLAGCLEMTKHYKHSERGGAAFGNALHNKNGWGIEWNKRKSRSYKTAPHMVVYHKGIQMSNMHKEFKERYIRHNIDDLARLEFNIKNKEHFIYLGGNGDTSLLSMASLKDEQIGKMALKVCSQILDRNYTKPRTISDLSPTDKMISNAISALILNTDMVRSEVVDMLLTGFDSETLKKTDDVARNARSRAKARINKLFDGVIHTDKKVHTKIGTDEGKQFFLDLFNVYSN